MNAIPKAIDQKMSARVRSDGRIADVSRARNE